MRIWNLHKKKVPKFTSRWVIGPCFKDRMFTSWGEMGLTFNQYFREDIPHDLKVKSCKASFIVLLIMNANHAFWVFCEASARSPVMCRWHTSPHGSVWGLNEPPEAKGRVEGRTGMNKGLKEVSQCGKSEGFGGRRSLGGTLSSANHLVLCKDITKLCLSFLTYKKELIKPVF